MRSASTEEHVARAERTLRCVTLACQSGKLELALACCHILRAIPRQHRLDPLVGQKVRDLYLIAHHTYNKALSAKK
jgi:hypothetical protein